jgi:hypothetical protein
MSPWAIRQAIRAVCDQQGVAVQFDRTNGGHQRALLIFRDQRRLMFFASTPSDWRAFHNIMARVRRGIREMNALETTRQALRRVS